MSNVDEGLVHAWVEGQLPPDEAARVAHVVETDPAWGAAAAEARGVIAGAARVLGALDEGLPSVNIAAGRTRQTRAKRSWRTATWISAAAAVVLMVGVGLFGRQTVPPPVTPTQAIPTTAVPSAPVAASGVADKAAEGVRDQVGVRDARGASGTSARNEVAPPPSQTKSAADAAAGVGAVAGVAANAAGATAAIVEQLNRPTLQREEPTRLTAMKTTAAMPPDSVLRGCWTPVAEAARADARAQRQAVSESAALRAPTLRFTAPVVTDLAGAAASAPARPPVSSLAGGGRGGRSAVTTSPPMAPPIRVQNASVHVQDDSTFVAEWLHADGKTTKLSFRLKGDTLRGTTNDIIGDMVIVGAPLVAVRGSCGQ